MRRRQRLAEDVEVAAIAPDAMHADDDAVVVGIAPLVVDDTMESVRRQASESRAARFVLAVSGIEAAIGVDDDEEGPDRRR